ncbi:MAG: tRNA lysidine(34) synthetase TilS [Alphaproteobacteria bacterium]|nr:tRNA lysidine(34) synthetase TilS [Alphaproteobacteria bacterium]
MTLNLSRFEKIVTSLKLSTGTRWAVAVSGGADSLCLTILLHELCQKNNIQLIALTVNHNIRPESLSEAQKVHSFCEKNGIFHVVLENLEPIGNKSVEEEARRIRYNLLTSYCEKESITHLFVAHQMEDQVETFLSRLARGSGVDGLSAIKPITKKNGITIVRPFLDVLKKDIVSFLMKKEIKWIEDPMNQDVQYERVKWRKFLPELEKNGLSKQFISLSTKRLCRVQETMQWLVQEAVQSCVTYFNEGYALIDKEKYLTYPTEVKIRILAEVVKTIGQSDKIISLELLERVVFNFPQKTTLANCILVPHKKGVFIAKEYSKIEQQKKIKANIWMKWDRFEIFSPVDGYIFANSPLKRKKNIPYLVQQSFPCFKVEKELENSSNIEYKENLNKSIKIKFIKDR